MTWGRGEGERFVNPSLFASLCSENGKGRCYGKLPSFFPPFSNIENYGALTRLSVVFFGGKVKKRGRFMGLSMLIFFFFRPLF